MSKIFASITIQDAAAALVAIAAGVVTISNAWKLVQKHLHPEADLRETVKENRKMLDNDNRRLNRHEEQLADAADFQGVMCRVMLAQLNHELSGNDVSHLKEARDELNEYLTKR